MQALLSPFRPYRHQVSVGNCVLRSRHVVLRPLLAMKILAVAAHTGQHWLERCTLNAELLPIFVSSMGAGSWRLMLRQASGN